MDTFRTYVTCGFRCSVFFNWNYHLYTHYGET